MTRAVIYVQGPVRPAERDVGRQKKLQACRAYCRRMGYDVVKVIATSQPEPDFADEAMRIFNESGRDALRAFLVALPHHPENDADALVASGEADVKVVFISIGDSGPFDWGYTPEIRERLPELPRVEEASLWELEPPTPEARQRHEWLMEDLARQLNGMPTRAGIYVHASPRPSPRPSPRSSHRPPSDRRYTGGYGSGYGNGYEDREEAKQQEQYCAGYCRERGYVVSQIYRDVRLSDEDDAHVALHEALRALEEADIHVLVALEEKYIAEDTQDRTVVLARAPRIEYAQSYANKLRLTAWLQTMEQLKAMLERRDVPHE